MSETPLDNRRLLFLASNLIAAYLSNNQSAREQIPDLIETVYRSLADLGSEPVAKPPPRPAVAIRRSVMPDYIVCLEDGKKFKTLKRHLRAHYGLSPAEYRDRWGLPPDYPMVAPNYADHRRRLAKAAGLGHRRSRA